MGKNSHQRHGARTRSTATLDGGKRELRDRLGRDGSRGAQGKRRLLVQQRSAHPGTATAALRIKRGQGGARRSPFLFADRSSKALHKPCARWSRDQGDHFA
jgi:hypothetical protein